jgi:hypothetical protein
VEQLLILIARAERKGGLDYAEGTRLREGVRYLAGRSSPGPGQDSGQDPAVVALRRKYDNARKAAWVWKRRATTALVPRPVPVGVDEEARDALARVVDLAKRWTYIPARRQAGIAVLKAISNSDVE